MEKDKIKRFIDCYVPVTTCNLRCHYCYITQQRKFDAKLPEFKYSAEHVAKALSKERLGGACCINFCGGGETLLPPEMIGIIRKLLEEGHYVMVVTNGTMSKRFDEIAHNDNRQLYYQLLQKLCQASQLNDWGESILAKSNEYLTISDLNVIADNDWSLFQSLASACPELLNQGSWITYSYNQI